MGKVDKCPFPPDAVASLKKQLIDSAAVRGFHLERRIGDRSDVPIDYRFLHVLLQLAGDPEVGLGEYSQGVRVGPGARMPRLPALFRPKRKWRRAYLEQSIDPGSVWRRNYASLATFEEQVLEVMHDQASRGQLLVYSEAEARRIYPDLVIASLGAQRKEKPGGKITARVLFGGTHGLCVNTRTRLRDQERAPIAADLKRAMREKAKLGELTFALSADVSEAHRQVPIHPNDWHLLVCQVIPGGEVFVNTVGYDGQWLLWYAVSTLRRPAIQLVSNFQLCLLCRVSSLTKGTVPRNGRPSLVERLLTEGTFPRNGFSAR